jgi:1-acyl-sn-glycerol-3-phosphate acyltransferase
MNHNSIMDIPAMAYAIDRPVFTMVKESLFKIPILSWWMKSVGFFPVRRGAGDRQAIENAREVLLRGDVLIMAPEGTRHRRTPGRPKAHTGIVRLAQEFRCPIVPVGVIGTRRILPPGAKIPRPFKLKIVVGEPILLDPVEVSPKNQNKLQEQANRIMDRVYELSGEKFD